MDFKAADDTIGLARKIFKKIGSGPLQENAFHAGKSAHDADDRIIYDKATGSLYYDADGTGAAAKIKFAGSPTRPRSRTRISSSPEPRLSNKAPPIPEGPFSFASRRRRSETPEGRTVSPHARAGIGRERIFRRSGPARRQKGGTPKTRMIPRKGNSTVLAKRRYGRHRFGKGHGNTSKQ